MTTKNIQKPVDKPDSMRQLEEFTRRVLAVPKNEVDKAAKKFKNRKPKK